MSWIRKNIDFVDVLVFVGLSQMSIGLWLIWGAGASLAIIGGLLILLGLRMGE